MPSATTVAHTLLISSFLLATSAGCSGEIGSRTGGQNQGHAGPSPGASRTGGSLGKMDPDNIVGCAPSSAPSIFKNALCLCGSYQGVGNLGIKPAADASGPGASNPVFGVNGRFSQLGNGLVLGTLIAHEGIDGANLKVTGSMRSNKTVGAVNLDVGADLFVGTDLTGFGLVLGGDLWVGGQVKMIFKSKPVTKLQGDLKAPCACGDDGLDVAAKVAAARASNDNAAAGLPQSPQLLSPQKLVLNTGRYYFAGGRALGNVQVVANGAVQIYVDGDLESVGNERIEMTDGSTVDMYVAGNVSSVGNVVVGQRYHPAAFRLYLGGSKQVTVRHIGNKRFRGAIYAPRANIEVLGNVEFEGALFVNTIANAGNVLLSFARPTHSPSGRKCVPPPSTSPNPADEPKTPGDPNDPSDPSDPNDPSFDDRQPRGPGDSNGPSDPNSSDFDDRQPRGDAPPNKDGLPDPADLPRVM